MKRVMLYVKYYQEDYWEPVWDSPRQIFGTGGAIQEEINKYLAGNKYPFESDGVVGYELREE